MLSIPLRETISCLSVIAGIRRIIAPPPGIKYEKTDKTTLNRVLSCIQITFSLKKKNAIFYYFKKLAFRVPLQTFLILTELREANRHPNKRNIKNRFTDSESTLLSFQIIFQILKIYFLLLHFK